MAGKGKIHLHPKAGTAGFDKHPENINKNGRPPKRYKRFKKETGLTEYNDSEIKEVYATVASMTELQVKEILLDDESDILLKIICRAFEKAKAKGDFRTIKDMIEMITGKAIQKVAQTDKDGNDLRKEPQSIEEIELEIKRLDEREQQLRGVITTKGTKGKTTRKDKSKKG